MTPTGETATKILVVDDLPEKLLVYRSILEQPGHEVMTASSGVEALRLVLRHEFAVILLDVNMPGMDGFETAAMISARKKCAHTPIIFLTAHADEMHALKGYSQGAVDFVLTPVVPEVLQAKVRVFVQLFRLNQQVREQAAQRVAMVQREQQHLTDVLERASDFVAEIGPDLRVLGLSRGARMMLGYPEPEPLPRTLADLLPAAAESLVRERGLPTAVREGVWFGESSLRTRSGGEVPVSQVILVHTGPDGTLERYSIVARDISARRAVEAELARHRAHLEELVRERTAELEASHERLRLADRLASIGTLAAGLGHDMGNLLLPVRMHLDALERLALPEPARQDVRAIAEACEYLKRLSRGLRNFALSPEDARASGATTLIEDWWADVEPFLRNGVPRGVTLEGSFAEGLPAIAMPPHVLTQSVYNLVQNAGDALKARGQGRITLRAEAVEDGQRVAIEVCDDGPGMTEEVLRRCMEPLFTTKTRTISTGLGLALVRGAVQNAGGTIDIRSAVGKGTRVRLVLPAAVAAASPAGESETGGSPRPRAWVSVADVRLRAYVTSVLRSLGAEVVVRPWQPDEDGHLLVVDDDDQGSQLSGFVARSASHRAVVLGPGQALKSEQVVCIDRKPAAAQLRGVLSSVLGRPSAEPQGMTR